MRRTTSLPSSRKNLPPELGEYVRLDQTASSKRWSHMPGNWDVINCRAIFPSANEWGIPDLPKATWVPDKLFSYASNRETVEDQENAAFHFFTDDYRFEIVWKRPEVGTYRVTTWLKGCLTPDFTMWREMPRVMQAWQVYRNRWCGNWFSRCGAKVVPTIGWAGPESYDFCFAGVPKHSVVAISTVGIIRADTHTRIAFYSGYDAMCEQLEPSTILIYGLPLPGLQGDIRYYAPQRRS